MLYELFRYDETFRLLYDHNRFTCACDTTDNRIMNGQLIKIHKGVDNLIKFKVYDSDRKRANISHLNINVTLINKQNKERVLTTTGRMESEKGFFSVTIAEGQLINISPGYYDFVVTGQEPTVPNQLIDVISTPFFTNQSGSVHLEAEVTDTIEKVPVPTTEIINWMSQDYTYEGMMTKLYYSSPIQANRLKNYKEALTTFTVQGEEFSGVMQVRGSLEHTAPPPSAVSEYFNVPVNGNAWTEYGPRDINNKIVPFSGLDVQTIRSNVLWLVFYWIPTDENGVPYPYNSINLPEPNRITRIQVRS